MKNNKLQRSSDLQSLTNVNQSFNEIIKQRQILPQRKKPFLETCEDFSFATLFCLIIIPIGFIIIGRVYGNSCLTEPDLPLFLTVFGCLILINLVLYTILGMIIAILLTLLCSLIVAVWWLMGTIWWVKLTIVIKSQLRYPSSAVFGHSVVYWTALVANIFGLIGFIIQICITVTGDVTASKQSSDDRG